MNIKIKNYIIKFKSYRFIDENNLPENIKTICEDFSNKLDGGYGVNNFYFEYSGDGEIDVDFLFHLLSNYICHKENTDKYIYRNLETKIDLEIYEEYFSEL